VINDFEARRIIADGAHACRELALAWSYDEDRARRALQLRAAYEIANRREWALGTARELAILSTDLAFSHRLVQIKTELQALAVRVTADQALDIGGDPIGLESDALLQIHRRPADGTMRTIGAADSTPPGRPRPRPRPTPHIAGRRRLAAG
jgi:hypothetical protein